MHQLSQGSRQSYFINEVLWSNFSLTLGLAGATNRKMVLVKFVYDRKINWFRSGTEKTKNIVSPYCLPCPFHKIATALWGWAGQKFVHALPLVNDRTSIYGTCTLLFRKLSYLFIPSKNFLNFLHDFFHGSYPLLCNFLWLSFHFGRPFNFERPNQCG